jgi:hypothetical protein
VDFFLSFKKIRVILKKENKVKVNDEKTIFYNFEALNAQLTRKSFLISKLN